MDTTKTEDIQPIAQKQADATGGVTIGAKPGRQSSEFAVTAFIVLSGMVPSLIVFFESLGNEPVTWQKATLAGLTALAAALTSMGYSNSRGQAKRQPSA